MANRGPRYDRITAPDQLFNAPDLTPQAQRVGAPYAAPTEKEVAQVPTTNGMIQLAGALQEVQPALRQYAGVVHQKWTEQEKAAAIEAHRKSGLPLAEAVRNGDVPAGASQLYQDTYQAQSAKRQADQFSSAAYQEYSNRPDVFNSDDPQAFPTFMQEFKSKYDQDHLYNPPGEDGTPGTAKYTPLQLKQSGYDDIVSQHAQALQDHNVKFRIEERTKKGEDIFSSAVQQAVVGGLQDDSGAPIESHARNYAQIAAGVHQSEQAMYASGLPTSKITELTALGVIQAAIDAKDASIIDKVGMELDKTRPAANPITGTRLWRQHAQTAKEHIAAQNYTDIIHKEQLGTLNVEGDYDTRMARHKEIIAQTDADRQRKLFGDAAAGKIFSYFDPTKGNSLESLKQFDQDLAAWRKEDPIGATAFSENVTRAQRQTRAEVMEREQVRAYVDVHNRLVANPGTRETNDFIDMQLKDGAISGAQWFQARQQSDSMGQAALKYQGVMADPFVTAQLHGPGKEFVKDPRNASGEESRRQTEADFQMTKLAYAYLDVHPKASNVELATYLHSQRELVMSSTPLNIANVEAEKAQKVEQDRVVQQALDRDKWNQIPQNEADLKYEKQHQPAVKPATQPKPSNRDEARRLLGPTPEELTKRMTVPEKTGIVDAAKRTFTPGIDAKPLSQGQFRDHIRETLKRHYPDAASLDAAVDGVFSTFAKKFTPAAAK